MNKKQLAQYKKDCLQYIERARKFGKPVLKMICPECFKEVESALSPKGTWNNKAYDICTKGCQECGHAFFVKMDEEKAVSFRIDTPHITICHKQQEQRVSGDDRTPWEIMRDNNVTETANDILEENNVDFDHENLM